MAETSLWHLELRPAVQALWSAPPSQFPRHTIVFWENKMNKQAEINPESSYLELLL